MNIGKISNVEAAKTAVEFLSESEKIALAKFLILGIEEPSLVDGIKLVAWEVKSHAEDLAAQSGSYRSDGSKITPYAPDGGPLSPKRVN